VEKTYAYVPTHTNLQFEGYARRCGLASQSELLKLLIKRELKLRRLPSGTELGGVTRQPPVAERKKITAHLPRELAQPFLGHIKQLGLSRSQATSILVQSELKERWLEAAIAWCPANE